MGLSRDSLPWLRPIPPQMAPFLAALTYKVRTMVRDLKDFIVKSRKMRFRLAVRAGLGFVTLGFSEAKAIIASFREALRPSPPPRLVALSSIGSEQSSGLGLITRTHMLEGRCAICHLRIAFIRAASFLDNYVPNLPAALIHRLFRHLPDADGMPRGDDRR
jgi:hypothetical protein